MGLSRRTIDYGRFTIVDYTSVQDVLDKLGLNFERVDYGRWRYRKGAFAGGHAVEVFWEGAVEGMGICVSISGEGCRLLEQAENFPGWQSWIRDWLDQGAKFTRLDLAIDDEAGDIKFESVLKAVQNRDYSCRSTTWGLHQSTGKRGTGQTLYVGSRQSMAMLRVYDRGFLKKADHSYLRFEWEFAKDRADAVARTLAYDGWDKAFGCARGFIEFKMGADRNLPPCRRRTAGWYAQLVSASRHVLDLSKQVQESVARSYGWIKRQCSQTLYALTELQGGAVDWIYELLAQARARPSDKSRRLASCGSQLNFGTGFALA